MLAVMTMPSTVVAEKERRGSVRRRDRTALRIALPPVEASWGGIGVR